MSLVDLKTDCELLGIDFRKKITTDDIRKAYKKKVLIIHPDKETGSTKDFQELNNAYRNLLDNFDLTNYFNNNMQKIFKGNKNLLNKRVFEIITADQKFVNFMYSNPIKQPVIPPLEINVLIKISDIIKKIKKNIVIKRVRLNRSNDKCFKLDLNYQKFIFPEEGNSYIFNNGEILGTLILNIIPTNCNNFVIKNKYDIHHNILLNHYDWLEKTKFIVNYFGNNINILLRKPFSEITSNTFRVIKCPGRGLYNKGHLFVIFYKTC
jgi:DnaJ-class molecular chaperone